VGFDIVFTKQQISSANVVARVKSLNKQKRPGVVVLGAHYDHLGAGFPGADDDASGIAALTEAARILSAHADLLGRDVVLVAFGAEEWGLRGSKAFLERWPKDQPIVAMIQADTVGRRGIPDVSVVGVSKYPLLAQVVSAALEQANLVVGKDIDQHAFAYGSDHWSFHEAGIPAVDLWSGDYAVMHTENDIAEGVDASKVSHIGRALAMAAIGIAGSF
jgi:Zn-dependent M28 family amino/carboxypeptidase